MECSTQTIRCPILICPGPRGAEVGEVSPRRRVYERGSDVSCCPKYRWQQQNWLTVRRPHLLCEFFVGINLEVAPSDPCGEIEGSAEGAVRQSAPL